MKAKARDWQIRLTEEIKHDKSGVFVTLTFKNEAITELNEYVGKKIEKRLETLKKENLAKVNRMIRLQENKLRGYKRDNEIAKAGVRLFLERWRKEHGKSVI